MEACTFYNLFSWEVGFGIRYGKSRLKPDKRKTMQEIVSGCSYMRLQFDTQAEEGYKEKPTEIVSVCHIQCRVRHTQAGSRESAAWLYS
uniref:Uncharacterized protein n=1 Tax=Aegilops tauschii subsp. strangulata TaxID=200361 RepID=A0A453EPG9_AEGTS